MNDSQLAELLRLRNPWWRDPDGWEADDDPLREVEESRFDYRPAILEDIAPPGLYILLGPRRVGKSVELKRVASRLIGEGIAPRQIVYCACDALARQDLRRLFAVGRSLTRGVEGRRYWLIDEVTAVSGWSAVVKELRDNTELRRDCVILTGSSARELRDATKDLAGRRGGVERSDRLLLPMSFRNFCHAIGGLEDVPRPEPVRPRDFMTRATAEKLDELSFWSDALTSAWELYISTGGFPRGVQSFLETGDLGPAFAREVWDVIRGDAFRRADLADPEILAFLARLARSAGTPLNATRVAEDVGLASYHRVNDRIDDLVVAFYAWRCYKSIGDRPNTRALRKVYFIDPLVARLASLRNARQPAPEPALLSEQQFGLALARAMEEMTPGSFVEAGGVMYEHTAKRAEIDFVGEELGVPFESKYVDRGWKKEARTLHARYGKGVMATRSIYDRTEEIWAVPTALAAWILS